MSAGAAITIALVLLVANAFFVGAEFALISARRSQIAQHSRHGTRRRKALSNSCDNKYED